MVMSEDREGNSKLLAGKDFPWEYLAGFYLLFSDLMSFAEVAGHTVRGNKVFGAYGVATVELPNPMTSTRINECSCYHSGGTFRWGSNCGSNNRSTPRVGRWCRIGWLSMHPSTAACPIRRVIQGKGFSPSLFHQSIPI